MSILTKHKAKYGASLITETKDWQTKHPLGPVHWDVYTLNGELIEKDVSAWELSSLLESKNLLKRW